MTERKTRVIDFGASSGRGIVGSFNGNKLTFTENHRFSNDPVILNGTMYWNLLRIFHEIKQSIGETVIAGQQITSMGIHILGVD